MVNEKEHQQKQTNKLQLLTSFCIIFLLSFAIAELIISTCSRFISSSFIRSVVLALVLQSIKSKNTNLQLFVNGVFCKELAVFPLFILTKYDLIDVLSSLKCSIVSLLYFY